MQPETSRRGTHYALTELGPPESWNRFVTQVGAPPGIRAPGKAFLAEALNMTGMEISANVMRPGGAVPFLHRHRRHEETYVILRGRRELQIDGQIIALHLGTVVCIKPVAGTFTYATPDTVVKEGDILVVAGETRHAEGFAELT